MKNYREKTILLLLIGISLSLVSGVVLSQNVRVNIPLVSTTHAPVTISGDSELDTFCSGDGTDGITWETAHVIENLEITGGGTEIALGLRDTTRYLVIRSCTLENSPNFFGSLDIINCTNINVTDCILKNNNYEGLVILRSSNLLISNTEIFGTSKGIYFYGGGFASTNIIITQNDIHDVSGSGIVADNLDDSTFSYNSIKNAPSNGINLKSACSNNDLICNTFRNIGLDEIKDEGTNNVITDIGCPSFGIPFYMWIIIGGAGAVVLTIVVIIIVKKKRK